MTTARSRKLTAEQKRVNRILDHVETTTGLLPITGEQHVDTLHRIVIAARVMYLAGNLTKPDFDLVSYHLAHRVRVLEMNS